MSSTIKHKKMGHVVVTTFLLAICIVSVASNFTTIPLNCSDITRVCESFIAYRLKPSETLGNVGSLFDVTPEEITYDENSSKNEVGYVFVRKNCTCAASRMQYLTRTTYTVANNGGFLAPQVDVAYEGLALLPNATRTAHLGAVVSLDLVCGCSNNLYNYLMSYVLGDHDTLSSLASRFGISIQDIEIVNSIADPNVLTPGKVYYIPLNAAPGVPLKKQEQMSPAPSPGPSLFQGVMRERNAPLSWGWILGLIGIALLVILILSLTYVLRDKLICYRHHKTGISKKENDNDIEKISLFSNSFSFCCGSRRNITESKEETNLPKDLVTGIFNLEKPVLFTFEEIFAATNNFKDTELLGNGAYGSVYYGVLRDQEVAIKRMKATKTKEFQVEMKVLCKVHHTNLVELIGYASSDDELFLVYEYAHNSSVSNHLHDPVNKGHAPLSWNARVQIALDAAKGLEYIHEHTRPHYVHRDIKTSNILLDNNFRAKISDFGLAKLMVRAADGEASTTRVVGTFGYLAPEYLQEGHATTKSDIYAFGVVLFELISGREALAKTRGKFPTTPERRSLISIMLSALRSSPSATHMSKLKECIDPNLMDLYPHDCVYKMAMLARQCVEEDPILRPDMKQIVLTLSQILLSSMEWESALAGNSQIFSGLVQGR